MKTFLALLLLGVSAFTFAEEEHSNLIFPPFGKEDMSTLDHPFPQNPSYAEPNSITVEELRNIMTSGSYVDRHTATQELVQRGDRETILRLVYSLNQGNVAA